MNEVRTFHPSSLGYLQVCPRFKNDETRDDSFAVRGTKLHALVEDENGSLEGLSEEDANAVKSCRSYLKERVRKMTPSDFVVRKEVRMNCAINRQANLEGTADVLITETNGRYAEVIDWKFGFGAIIPAKVNPQTMSYAYMVFKSNPLIAQVTTTVVCPLQEDNLIDTHTWDRADLPSIQMVLDSVTSRVLDEKQGPVLNWSVCRYCGAKATCSQMSQVMLRTSEVTTPATVLELLAMKTLPPDVRGKWQQVAEWADDWAKQVKRTNLDAVLTDGEDIEGYSIVRRKGSVKVEQTDQAVEKLVSLGYDRNIIMAACSLSLPSLTKGLENLPPEQKGGAADEVRATLEELLSKYLREGEPVVYLKRSKSKAKKKEINA
jgi:hypothetical protein